jgi:alpha-galactosidase
MAVKETEIPFTQTPALAQAPPMGWNSWNGFGKNIDEQLIREMAEAMLSTGMKEVGYRYVVIDDLWHGGRDRNGSLYPDRQRFPSGMKALADEIHSRGLKFGIYSDAGPETCAGAPGSLGFEERDAATFFSWGVDFLKYDYCYAPEDQKSATQLYKRMGRALATAGRPILYSICEWGERQP